MVKAENHVPVFETTLQTTHEWLRELMGVALLHNQKEAYALQRGEREIRLAYLAGCRPRLTGKPI